jgi:CBS domain-containing protein
MADERMAESHRPLLRDPCYKLPRGIGASDVPAAPNLTDLAQPLHCHLTQRRLGGVPVKVADVMTRHASLVSPQASVRDAAESMAEHDVGAVLVGDGGALAGILTDRDVILRVVVEGRDPNSVRVQEVMSSHLYTCREDDPVELAFQLMTEHQVRRLPVMDEEGALVGIVTLSDLGRLAADPEQVTAVLRNLAEPHRRRDSTGTAPAE